MKNGNLQELHHLVGALLDTGIADADFDRLQFLLRDDPECREAYHEYCELHVELQLRGTKDAAAETQLIGTDFVTAFESAPGEACKADGDSAAEVLPAPTWRNRLGASRVSSISALAFGLSACLMGIILGQIVGSPQDDVATAARSRPVWQPSFQPVSTIATFAGGVNAKFRNGLSSGSRIEPGRLQLEQGIAEIVFDRGAVLVLKGPAELDLVDASSCYIRSGIVSAKVGPDAHGFVVRTDAMQVSEFDAEFGLRTTPDAMTELHVFDGELRLTDVRDTDRSVRLVTSGNALRFGKDAPADAFAADPSVFVSRDELARQKRWEEEQAYERWKHYSHRWAIDPAAIVRYDFGLTEDGSIVNLLTSKKHLAVSRQSVPRWLEGRWSDKRAMLFDGRTDFLSVSDHPDLSLEGDFTVAVWFKARSQPHCWTRIVGKGAGADRNYGLWMNSERQLLWQICPDEDPQSQSVWDRSGVFSNSIPVDRWVLAVGVIDHQAMKIYIDGELHAGRRRAEGDGFALSDAPLTIGYYDDVPGHNAYFSGEIDELLLLRRALSSDEVREMYEAGRPGIKFVPVDGTANSFVPRNASI